MPHQFVPTSGHPGSKALTLLRMVGPGTRISLGNSLTYLNVYNPSSPVDANRHTNKMRGCRRASENEDFRTASSNLARSASRSAANILRGLADTQRAQCWRAFAHKPQDLQFEDRDPKLALWALLSPNLRT